MVCIGVVNLLTGVSLLSGCAYKRMLIADAKGKEIKTRLGKVKADVYYKSILCLGASANDCKEFKKN